VISASGTSLTLRRRAAEAWKPPQDLRVNVMSTRFPISFECPKP
jgi:hypothetical protein